MSLRPALIRGLLAAVILAIGALPGHAFEPGDEVRVTVVPATFARLPGVLGTGRLTFLGGLELHSEDRRFGGFSGLAISPDGARIVAASDRGWWLTAQLEHADGRLAGATGVRIGPMLDAGGQRPSKKSRRDAEALAPFGPKGADGDLLAGFERSERVERFAFAEQGMAARPEPVATPKSMAGGPYNKELESLARFWEGPRTGWLMAISEANRDTAGNIRGWLWKGSRTIAFAIARHEDYDITDAAVLPGGEAFVTLERSYSPSSFPGTALRRFPLTEITGATPARGELLFEGRQPLYAIDNMEGLAIHRNAAGEVVATIISDDNYNRKVQRTLIFQFRLD